MSLVVVGLGLSGYLLTRTLQLLVFESVKSIDACQAMFGYSCDATLLSATSWQMGIPLAGWGVVYFGTLACLLILAWSLGEAFEKEGTLAAVLLAVAGVAGSIALTVSLILGRSPFCPACLAVHGVNLLLLLALLELNGQTLRQIFARLGAAARYVMGAKSEQPQAAAWKVVGLFTAALVATVLYQWVLVESERRKHANQAEIDKQLIDAHRRTARREIPLAAANPRLGDADAPVKLVVFSSFECRGCQDFARELAELHQSFPHRLEIVFKHFPLGTACNPAMEDDKQPGACQAAWAAEAARQQDRFWPFHDDLFDSGLVIASSIEAVAAGAGLDEQQFGAAWQRDATKQVVADDVALGMQLGVQSTPYVFLNGRRVQQLSARALTVLVLYELRQ